MSDGAHPCAGVWRPLTGALDCERGERIWKLDDPDAFAGVTIELSEAAEHPGQMEALLDQLDHDEVPLRIDLAPADTGAPTGWGQALDYGADLITVRLPRLDDASLGYALQLGLRLEGEDTALVWELPDAPPSGARGISEEFLRGLVQAALGSESCVALRLNRFDEELAQGLDTLMGHGEDPPLALFAPSWEFATAFRYGITALDGELGLMTPSQIRGIETLLMDDVGEALVLERRIQRFLEGPLERVVRGRRAPGARAALIHDLFRDFEKHGGAASDPDAAIDVVDLFRDLMTVGLPTDD